MAKTRLQDKECPTCGKLFHPKNHTTKFCSKKCSSKSLSLQDKECPTCGKMFHPVKSNTIYCCNECYLESHKRKPTLCKTCGKEFTPNHTGQEYCSRDCQRKSLRKLDNIVCTVCGKEFRPKNSSSKFCCRECQYKAKSEGNKIRWASLSEEEKQKQIAPLFDYNHLEDISKINLEYGEYLKGLGFNVEYEKKLGWGAYDLCVDNVLIDINPFPRHNVTWHPKDNPRSKEYHRAKLKMAIENGYRCIMVRDWDNKENISNLLDGNKIKVGARECELKKIGYNDCHIFFETNHLQGDTKKDKNNIYVGLFYKGEMLMAMSFGKPRQNKNYEWEILRLCTLKGYNIVGGASKIFNYFIELTNADSVISYCDMSKFNGKVYEQLGFKLLKWNQPSKHWYNGKIKQHITDGLVRQCGYDKLFNTNYGKGISNDELMKQSGYVEIYDCGQATYIYKTKKL